MEKPKLPDSAHIETIVLSSDDEEDILTIKRDSTAGGHVDANDVIHIDSDSEAEAKIASTHPHRNSAPQGISLTALQATPPGGVVVDLTAMVDEPLASPSTRGQDPLALSPKKRGSVSLRLDLSSEALRGVPFTDAQPPSPVTLAPRTARPMSAHPSLASGMNPFFPDPANTDPGLLPHLLTTIATQSQAQSDIIGGAAGPSTGSHMLDLPVRPAPSSHIDSMMSLGDMDDSHRMDLDLFGEIIGDDSEGAMAPGDSAIAGNTQELQQLLLQPPEAAGLNDSLNTNTTMSQAQTEAGSADASQQTGQPAASAEITGDSFTTNNSTISEPSQTNSLPTETSIQPERPQGQQQQQGAPAQPAGDVPASNSDQIMAQMEHSEAGTESAVGGAGTSLASQQPNDPSAMSLESLQSNNVPDVDMTFSEFDLPGLDDVAGMNLDDIALGFPDFLGDTTGGLGIGDGSSMMDLTNFGDMDLTAMLNSFDNPNPNPGEAQ